jgi:ABC-type antimicrobial peptide transport system permease subunit
VILKWINRVMNAILICNMFLCFFSLSANMAANLYAQTKEVGVLRAIGLTRSRIRVLYFYEAFVLILASCCIGITIGVVCGYTWCIQLKMLTKLDLPFFFPWE